MNAKLIINADIPLSKIDKNIYGHFSEHLGRCIYEGLWVGEDSSIPNIKGIRIDVLNALKNIQIPTLRWPGGCFADEYHWKDGIGPRELRKRMVNSHWGGVVENNHFGTHEFLMLCELLGCEPYINGNVGSGSVQEMQEWIEYMTFDGESPMANMRALNGRKEPWKIKFFGVGNETWGCGGNMRVEYYADEYRRYQTYVRHYGNNKIFKIASGANVADYHWTEVMMREARQFMDGITLHRYTFERSWEDKGNAVDFTEDGWFSTLQNALKMDELISRHRSIMDQYDPESRVALIVDEWGDWFNVEKGTNPGFLYQQNTMRDALVAGITLNIFNSHSARVRMANLAQMINVLQSVILTEGSKIVLTPTYYIFEMYKTHQDSQLLDMQLESPSYEFNGQKIPQISASASKSDNGIITITLCNLHPRDSALLNLDLRGLMKQNPKVSARILKAKEWNSHNTFDNPTEVEPQDFSDYTWTQGLLEIHLPAVSVLALTCKS